MSSGNDLRSVDTHFAFGDNWREYSEKIDEATIVQAEIGLLKLISPEQLQGARFLDIGCGSGLHSLAASRLGAGEIVALDIDPVSVSTTRKVLADAAVAATVREMSIFAPEIADLGQFDIVYSWGVLHHTGDMWTAIRRAATLVRPGGLFVIAIYHKTRLCGAWKVEKRAYSRAPKVLQAAARGIYVAALAVRMFLAGANPVRYIREYSKSRGMNFYNDVHDWLGGYPYESAAPTEIEEAMRNEGFAIHASFPSREGIGMGLFGTGCSEYVLVRPSAPVSGV
ncbi:MAG: class I SAM-dependent methyltransferase [Sphingomonadales bacterium]|nr:MAG: class I SAM-dependent methyltransferase [Sphingomonadales bacterium]